MFLVRWVKTKKNALLLLEPISYKTMENNLEALLAQAESKHKTISFIVAGGGMGLFDLFKIKGCSRVLTEARVLYSNQTINSFLGSQLTSQYVSQDTADALASALASKSEADICFALTCALMTDRQRLGEDHGYLSIYEQGKISYQKYTPVEGESRLQQDGFISQATINSVVEYLSIQIL